MKNIVCISSILLMLVMAAFGQERPVSVAPAGASDPSTPVDRTAPAPVTPPFGAGFGGVSLYSGSGIPAVTVSSAGVPPVVVRFAAGHDDGNAAMEEDLNVMSRLIERSLEREVGEDSTEVK